MRMQCGAQEGKAKVHGHGHACTVVSQLQWQQRAAWRQDPEVHPCPMPRTRSHLLLLRALCAASAPATGGGFSFGTSAPAFGATTGGIFGTSGAPGMGAQPQNTFQLATTQQVRGPGQCPLPSMQPTPVQPFTGNAPGSAAHARPTAQLRVVLDDPTSHTVPTPPSLRAQAGAQLAQVGQDAAIKEINEIRMAYTPASPSYKFNHLFLNVVDNPQQRVKPQNVDEMRWRQAMAQAGGPNNQDK